MKFIKNKDFFLRPLKMSDLDGYWEVCQDKEAQKNWTSYPKTYDEARKDVVEMLKEVKEKGSDIFTIEVNKKYAGNIILQYQNFDKLKNEARVHLWIHPEFRGRGLATKVMVEIIAYGFEKKRFKRIFAQSKASNKAVIKVNKKCGFKIVKTYTTKKDRYHKGGIKKILLVMENTLFNKKKYRFLPYSDEYPNMFEKEKIKIIKLLGTNILIEHVGSTSIPGLGGKGIIDISIKTPKNKVKLFVRKLKKLGYVQVFGHNTTNNSIFTQKIIKSKGKESRIHVHLALNDKFWNTFIAFRDYLRTHDKEREKYALIKKEAVKYAGGQGRKYREYKSKFLEETTKKALREMK